MLPALATLAKLEARLGLDPDTLADPERARAQAALDDASALVRDEARRDWPPDEDDTPTVPDAVERVVLGAALRTYRNPDGEITKTVGPFTRTVSADASGVYLTDAEKEIVRRYRPTGGTRLWTQRTTKYDPAEPLFVVDELGTPFLVGGTSDYDLERPL
jgi:hypothetical protein